MNAYLKFVSKKHQEELPEIFTAGSFTFSIGNSNYSFDFKESNIKKYIKMRFLIVEIILKDFDYDYFNESNKTSIKDSSFFISKISKIKKFNEIFYECFLDQEENIHIDMKLINFVLCGDKNEIKIDRHKYNYLF